MADIFETKVSNTIKKYNLIDEKEKVIVALSGGMDSMALVFVLKKLGYNVVCCHYNHGIRGNEADRDEKFVEAFAKENNLPYFVGRGKVLEMAKANGNLENVEDLARKMRYEFLNRIAKEENISKIAVAHHLKDQAETMLIHLFRGAGLNGISGMKIQNGNIIRPFLNIKKEEIEAYCLRNNISWVHDSTNDDVKYLRNNIRLELWEKLLEYNPNLEENLGKTGEILQDENSYLDSLANEKLNELSEENILNYNEFLKLPNALKRRVIRKYFYNLTNVELDFYHTEELISLENNKQISLNGGYYGKNANGKLYLQDRVFLEKEEEKINIVNIKADEEYNVGEYFFKTSLVDNLENIGEAEENTCYIPLEYLDKLVIRSREEGDFISLSCGSKKIKKLFIDLKIPKEKRNLPFVAYENEVLWLPKIRKSVKINEKNITSKTKCLKIEIFVKNKI